MKITIRLTSTEHIAATAKEATTYSTAGPATIMVNDYAELARDKIAWYENDGSESFRGGVLPFVRRWRSVECSVKSRGVVRSGRDSRSSATKGSSVRLEPLRIWDKKRRPEPL